VRRTERGKAVSAKRVSNRPLCLVVLLACGGLAAPALAQGGALAPDARKLGIVPATARSEGGPSRYLPNRFSGKAGRYYRLVWGIDSLRVKLVESGEIVRFTWRVLDPDKAKQLNDEKAEPALIDPQKGVSLVVPRMEKVGQLRQVQPPEAGRSYWMAFSNHGRVVKPGDRVDVVIGLFRAEGLAVD
jgi:hypothetical protein